MTDSINESSESSQLPVTVTIFISVNIYCCKPYISLCYSFLALQDHSTRAKHTVYRLSRSFSHQLVAFRRNLSESKPLQLSRILLYIQADFSIAVIKIVSFIHLISSSYRLFFPRFLGTVPMAPNTIGTTVTFRSHSFFQLIGKVHVFVLLFAYFYFHSAAYRHSKIHFLIKQN